MLMNSMQIFGIICIALVLISNGYKYEYMRTLVGKYKILIVEMGKVIVEMGKKTLVLVMLADTQFEIKL
jgi:hypothetical protein